MYLSRLTVDGLRAGVEAPVTLTLPSRFSVLVGANAAGKTTIADGLYLGHTRTFPHLPRPSSSALASGRSRSIEVEYTSESDPAAESPFGNGLRMDAFAQPGEVVARWTRSLNPYLGKVSASTPQEGRHPRMDEFRLIYLPAWRNPLDELARRETLILVQLLRAQQQKRTGRRDLSDLRALAARLLETLAKDGLLEAVEERVAQHLASLSSGVARQWAYVRGQAADDAYLARVLQFMLATIEGRRYALPLDVSGLGYVNLLHIAITLAAIPDTAAVPSAGTGPDGSADSPGSGAGASIPAQAPGPEAAEGEAADPAAAAAAARVRLEQTHVEAASAEDSFFTDRPFHATVVIEEPEAHLHPQLQHGLVRYLRQITRGRPEIQIILSSHAPEIISACDPREVVVVRRDRTGQRVCRPIAGIPMAHKDVVLRKTRLHLDASRSSALFAERLVLVEGVSEAAVLRKLGAVWAGDDPHKAAFVDALSVVAMGTKVGEWGVALLATPGHELCHRLAVLRDTDQPFEEDPRDPDWMWRYDRDTVEVFPTHPTLEPALTRGNEGLVRQALVEIGADPPSEITPQAIHDLFRSARKKNGQVVLAAGPAVKRKGEFALALAEQIVLAADDPWQTVTVPGHIVALFDYLYDDMVPPEPSDEGGDPATASPDPSAPDRLISMPDKMPGMTL